MGKEEESKGRWAAQSIYFYSTCWTSGAPGNLGSTRPPEPFFDRNCPAGIWGTYAHTHLHTARSVSPTIKGAKVRIPDLIVWSISLARVMPVRTPQVLGRMEKMLGEGKLKTE